MISEARLYQVLSIIIDKLENEVGMENTDIKNMLEISQEEKEELYIQKEKLN